MNGIAAHVSGRGENGVHDEVRLGGWCRSEAYGRIRHLHMERIRVRVRVDGDGLEASELGNNAGIQKVMAAELN